jgi:hypothetical protein
LSTAVQKARPRPQLVSPCDTNVVDPVQHNNEAERIVLGSAILHKRWLDAAIRDLRVEDFFLSEHRAVFAAMIELRTQSAEVDTPTLFQYLSSGGRLEAAGGVGYLSQLADDLHHVPNVQHYIDRVKDCADLRQIAHTSFALYQRALDPDVDSEELASYVEVISQIVTPLETKEATLKIPDLSDSALDGRLGDICLRRLAGFPLSYAWTAIITAAGTLVPRTTEVRTNLFSCQVGPIGSGKSQVNERSLRAMGIVEPVLQNVMAGSVEGMVEKLGNANGECRAFCPDEIGHLLTKARIDNATFSFVLNRAYYKDEFDVTMARGKQVHFNCSLSILGGLVDENFEDLFGSATTAGLYDRFIFGLCPRPFEYRYRPMEGGAEDTEPCPVAIAKDVWDARDEWIKTIPGLTDRCAEHAIRVATVAAAFSGQLDLSAKHLGPARAFAEYQARIRKMLQPNPGENPVAKCAHATLAALGDSTAWHTVRDIGKKIHSERFGPSVFEQTLRSLEGVGEVLVDKKRPARIRRIGA